jgi:hypothetical protein
VVRAKQGGLIVFFGLALMTALGCQQEGIQHYQVRKPGSTSDQLGYAVPDAWKKLGPDPKGFYDAGFQLTDGDQQAQITITPLTGAGGGLLLNTNRWRRQLHLEAIDEEQLEKDLQELQVAGTPVKYLDLTGPEAAGQPRQRLLAVVLPGNRKTWFFKMMGPAELVEKQKPTFEAFVKSVTFDERTGNKDG